MAWSELFLRTRDIDWAVNINGIYIHASSAGDDLPYIVDQNLFGIWKILKSSKIIYTPNEVQLNEAYLETKFPRQKLATDEELQFRKEWYVHSFRTMAMRGFYSFDRDINSPIGDSTYHLVASPGAGQHMELNLELPYIESQFIIEDHKECKLVEIINKIFTNNF